MTADGVASAADGGMKTLSLRKLLLLFAVALLLFCGLRWDGDQWLQQQLAPRLASYGVHATAVMRDGDRLRLDNVAVDGVDFAGSPLQLEQLIVAPKWLSLLRLEPTAQVSMRWQQAVLDAEVERVDHDQLAIHRLSMSLPVAMIAPLLPSMPVTLAGAVMCRGSLQWSVAQSLPEQPDIVCDWQQATATMGSKPIALGDYQLVVRSKGADWLWTLTGGDVAKIQGKGMIHPAVDLPFVQWLLDGSLTASAGKGILGAMVGTMLGTQAHAISGTLGAPVFH